MNELASWAEHLAQALLQDSLPRRWAHVQGVAAQARSLAPALGTDAELLEAAAWLHDIGYAPSLVVTGLHSLDAPGTSAMSSTLTPCSADWSRTIHAPPSKPGTRTR